MAALTLFQTSTNDTLVTTARQLSTTAPGSETSVTQKTGKSVNWGEHFSQGNSSAWGASASEPSPSGHGWIWDVTTLEGQQIAAGTWTFKVKLGPPSSGAQTACTIACRAYKRSSAGVFTQIVDAQLTAQSIQTAATVYTVTGSGSASTFATGDKLYVDLMVLIGANSSSSTTATTPTFENLSTNESIVTPGFGPPPVSGTASLTGNHAALAASGAEAISGTSAVSSQKATLSAAASVTDSGTSALSAKKATLSASGSVTAGVSGTASLSAHHATLAASGGLTVSGASSLTARHTVVAASGTETISGSSSLTGKHATVSASGAERVSGTASLSAHKASVQASGAETISGTSALGGRHATLSASGTTGSVISGSAAVSSHKGVLASAGIVTIAGTGSLTGRHATLAASASLIVTAAGGVTAKHPTLQAVGGITLHGTSVLAAPHAVLMAVGFLGSVAVAKVPVDLDRGDKPSTIELEDDTKPSIDLGRSEHLGTGIDIGEV